MSPLPEPGALAKCPRLALRGDPGERMEVSLYFDAAWALAHVEAARRAFSRNLMKSERHSTRPSVSATTVDRDTTLIC
jgi:hypothetical protein